MKTTLGSKVISKSLVSLGGIELALGVTVNGKQLRSIAELLGRYVRFDSELNKLSLLGGGMEFSAIKCSESKLIVEYWLETAVSCSYPILSTLKVVVGWFG